MPVRAAKGDKTSDSFVGRFLSDFLIHFQSNRTHREGVELEITGDHPCCNMSMMGIKSGSRIV